MIFSISRKEENSAKQVLWSEAICNQNDDQALWERSAKKWLDSSQFIAELLDWKYEPLTQHRLKQNVDSSAWHFFVDTKCFVFVSIIYFEQINAEKNDPAVLYLLSVCICTWTYPCICIFMFNHDNKLIILPDHHCSANHCRKKCLARFIALALRSDLLFF